MREKEREIVRDIYKPNEHKEIETERGRKRMREKETLKADAEVHKKNATFYNYSAVIYY